MFRRSCFVLPRPCTSPVANMSPPTYASVASRNLSHAAPVPASQSSQSESQSTNHYTDTQYDRPTKRSQSPPHIPRTEAHKQHVYVLTIQTGARLHRLMTELRQRYFPKHLNKLDAHLTLFHALPGSKLEGSIIPTIEQSVTQSSPFKVHADKPFRLKRGIAINIAQSQGFRQAQEIRQRLQKPWRAAGFLSEQDAGGARPHYTIMNKVEEEETVAKAFKEVCDEWKGEWGVAEGLRLWRYDRGFWRPERSFLFIGREEGNDVG